MTEKNPAPRHAPEPLTTAAERHALEVYERARRRRLELAELGSDLNPPDARIRAWERVHALRLPSDPRHPVLRVVATATGLTLAQVRDEQQARLAQQTAHSQGPEPPGKG